MKTSTMALIGVGVAAVGVGGYFLWKKYSGGSEAPADGENAYGPSGVSINVPPRLNVTPAAMLRGMSDGGVADYNAYVAAAYWKRQREMWDEKLRLASMKSW